MYRSMFFLRFAAVSSLLSTLLFAGPAISAETPTQLPRTVRPLKYDVQLEPDMSITSA